MKPKSSVREMLEEKKQKTQEREENFRQKFDAAPKRVQDEYYHCEKKIKKFFKKRSPKKIIYGFEKVLYDPSKCPLAEPDIVWLHELLCLQGWNVIMTAAAVWRGKGPRPLGLLFRHYGK